MPKIVKLNVRLLNYTRDMEQTIAAAVRQCYSSIGAKELFEKISIEKRKILINQVVNSGHTSTIEHAIYTYAIEGISRVTSHQLVRHRIASYSQQSQRYVKIKNSDEFECIIPSSIVNNPACKKRFISAMKIICADYQFYIDNGILPEDARYELPNAAATKIVVSMNPRALYNFFKERLCLRAQWEIRAMAKEMLKIAEKKAPILFSHVGPTCETELICRQGKRSCGKWKAIEDARLIDPMDKAD